MLGVKTDKVIFEFLFVGGGSAPDLVFQYAVLQPQQVAGVLVLPNTAVRVANPEQDGAG